MTVYELREQIRERVAPRTPGSLSILIESFGYKHGLPAERRFRVRRALPAESVLGADAAAAERQGRAGQGVPRRGSRSCRR